MLNLNAPVITVTNIKQKNGPIYDLVQTQHINLTTDSSICKVDLKGKEEGKKKNSISLKHWTKSITFCISGLQNKNNFFKNYTKY